MAKKDLKFNLDFKTLVDPEEYFDELKHPIGRAVTAAMRDVSAIAKEAVRADVRRNFRSHRGGKARFEHTFRSYDFPDEKKHPGRFSYGPAATIQANPSWAHIFEDGGIIRPARSGFLAIPTKEAEKRGLHEVGQGRGHSRRLSQTDKARRMFGQLFPIQVQEGEFEETYLAAKEGEETLFLFNLRPWTRQKKRVSLERRAAEAFKLLPTKFRTHFKG